MSLTQMDTHGRKSCQEARRGRGAGRILMLPEGAAASEGNFPDLHSAPPAARPAAALAGWLADRVASAAYRPVMPILPAAGTNRYRSAIY